MKKIILFLFISIICKPLNAENNQWEAYAQDVHSDFEHTTNQNKKTWADYQSDVQSQIESLWGPIEKPTPKELIKYSASNQVRITINYENGTVLAQVIQFKKQVKLDLQKKAQTSISEFIKMDQNKNAEIKPDEFVLNGKNMNDYLKNLTKKLKPTGQIVGMDGNSRPIYSLKFKLVSNLMQKRAKEIFPIVRKYSEKYDLDPAFVLAVIRQESAFNPQAKSWVPAFGLMQIVPAYAGKEVITYLSGQGRIPSSEALYDIEKNILIGTTYLHILRDKYFAHISDATKKQFLITCSYNWGPARIQKVIESGKVKLTIPTEKLFSQLLLITPNETKEYLKRVTVYHTEFKNLIKDWTY